MDAVCPECFDNDTKKNVGCPKCEFKGKIQVGFAEGPLYTRACQNPECGYENGGFIVMEGMKTGPNGEPPEPPRECIVCKSPCKWKKLSDSMDGFLGEFEKAMEAPSCRVCGVPEGMTQIGLQDGICEGCARKEKS